jgi:nitrite reductase/ring-hydroxylating ferredoxin subunit
MKPVCRVDEIEPGVGREARIDTPGGKKSWIALFRCDTGFVAYQNVCPHQGRALSWAPDRFMIGDDGLLVCPHHGASFRLSDGHCVSGPCSGESLQAVAIKIVNDEIWLAETGGGS